MAGRATREPKSGGGRAASARARWGERSRFAGPRVLVVSLLSLVPLLLQSIWSGDPAVSEEGDATEALHGDREKVRIALAHAFNRKQVAHQAWTWSARAGDGGESATFLEMYRSPPLFGFLVGSPDGSRNRGLQREMIVSNDQLTVFVGEGGVLQAVVPAAGALNQALPAWRRAQALISTILGVDLDPISGWSPHLSLEFDGDAAVLRPAIEAICDCGEGASWLEPTSFDRVIAIAEGRVQVEGISARMVLRQEDGMLESMEALDDGGRVTHSLRPHAVSMTPDAWKIAISEQCARVPEHVPTREQVRAWVLYVLQMRAVDAARVLRTLIEADSDILAKTWRVQGVLEILVGTLYTGHEDLAEELEERLTALRAEGHAEDAETRVAGEFFATVWPHFKRELRRSGAGPMAITKVKDSLWRLHAQRAHGGLFAARER